MGCLWSGRPVLTNGKHLKYKIDNTNLGNSCKFAQHLPSRNQDNTHLFGSIERVPAVLHEQTSVSTCGWVILCIKSSCKIFWREVPVTFSTVYCTSPPFCDDVEEDWREKPPLFLRLPRGKISSRGRIFIGRFRVGLYEAFSCFYEAFTNNTFKLSFSLYDVMLNENLSYFYYLAFLKNYVIQGFDYLDMYR